MTQNANDKDNNDFELSSLYQRVSNEMPSAELDKNILWQAKQVTDNREANEKVIAEKHYPPKKKENRFWFKWQWGGSVAASALVLSVIWVVEKPEQAFVRLPESEPQLVLMDEATSIASTSSAEIGEEASVQASLANEVVEKRSAASFSAAPQELVESDVTELSSVTQQADDTPVRETENAPRALDELLAQVKNNRRSEAVEGSMREAEFQKSRSLLKAEIAASGLKSDAGMPDVEIDRLVVEAKRYQRVLYNTEIQNAEDEKRLNSELTAVQVKIIEVIKVRKQQKPDWVIETQYLDVLTPEQRKQLLD